MATRIEGRIDEWASHPVADGHSGLHALADDSFTGAIKAPSLGIAIAMLNGRVVGVFDGTLDALADTALEAYEAPHPSLPLLWVMQDAADEPRAQYYTGNTPLSEVDDTLSSGGFTGYIELSENVLSGDYYQVYYGGRSLSVAFVGQSEQRLTDDEAFDRAAGEVGIFEVFDVDITVHELPDRPPEPEAPPTPPAGDSGGSSDNDRGSDATPEQPASPQPADGPSADVSDYDLEATEAMEAAVDTPSEEPAADTSSSDPQDDAELGASEDTSGVTMGSTVSSQPAVEEPDPDVSSHTVPSLDPARSNTDPTVSSSAESTTSQSDEAMATADMDDVPAQQRVQELIAEREKLATQLEEAQRTNTQLQEEIDRLNARITELETAQSTPSLSDTSAGQQLSPMDALSQTDLFVRYASKSQTTLDDISQGATDRTELEANLSVEHHTRFDETAVTVQGDPFEAFLRSTMPYQFVEWLLLDLLYEIRETGNQDGLKDLYTALPRIDRIQFHSDITVGTDTETDTSRDVSFGLIARDRMGDPLLVARFDDSRDPATESMIADLHTAVSTISKTTPSVQAAFAVTASFFQPDALATAAEAAGGGLLSRDARRSHVKVSRKQGYHLCLVEVRDGGHHMTVPEL